MVVYYILNGYRFEYDGEIRTVGVSSAGRD